IDIKDLINQRVAGDHNGHRQANKKAIELEISLHFYSLFSPCSSVIHNPYLFKTSTKRPDSGAMMLEPCRMAIVSLYSRQRLSFPSRVPEGESATLGFAKNADGLLIEKR
ncbi:TPA: hypothetical protein I8587_001536, partial [Serratia marcescens]|nr:hypothetical protein [Serratia marcescens]